MFTSLYNEMSLTTYEQEHLLQRCMCKLLVMLLWNLLTLPMKCENLNIHVQIYVGIAWTRQTEHINI